MAEAHFWAHNASIFHLDIHNGAQLSFVASHSHLHLLIHLLPNQVPSVAAFRDYSTLVWLLAAIPSVIDKNLSAELLDLMILISHCSATKLMQD